MTAKKGRGSRRRRCYRAVRGEGQVNHSPPPVTWASASLKAQPASCFYECPWGVERAMSLVPASGRTETEVAPESVETGATRYPPRERRT
jgi:hypothetical protein